MALGKVYSKLGVSSRRELRRAMVSLGPDPSRPKGQP